MNGRQSPFSATMTEDGDFPGLSGKRNLIVILNWRDRVHPQAGGAEVVCERLAEQFVGRGWNVRFLCAHVKGHPRTEVRDGYTVVRRGKRFTVYPRLLFWLLLHRRQVAGVVDSQNGIPFFSPLVLPRRTPILLLLHHIHQEQFSSYFPRPIATVGRWLESFGCRTVYGKRTVVAVSPSTRSGARKNLKLRGNICVIPSGWTIAGTTAGGLPRRATNPTVVSVGRLVPHKRQLLLIEAAAGLIGRMPDLAVHIVGSGPEHARLQSRVVTLGLQRNVRFHQSLSNQQRDELIASSWLVVLPSQGEGWGLTVLEANALGVPAVAFRVPGLRDSIVAGETGWLLESVGDLAEGVAKALDELRDEARALEIADSTRAWAARFTWESMADRYRCVLEAEARRLRIGHHDRRSQSDIVTVVRAPRSVLMAWPGRQVRRTDIWHISDDEFGLLLHGADTSDAQALLTEVGLTADETALASTRVARSVHLLHPGFGRSAEHVSQPREQQRPTA